MNKTGGPDESRFIAQLLHSIAGINRHYIITLSGQAIFGILYSTGIFDIAIVGITLGLFLPALWTILVYRIILDRANQGTFLPLPRWVQLNPGNTIVIVLDIIFLSVAWALILSGLYDAVWFKILFTVVLPLIILFVLRILVLTQSNRGNL